jgi:hypothetical protein
VSYPWLKGLIGEFMRPRLPKVSRITTPDGHTHVFATDDSMGRRSQIYEAAWRRECRRTAAEFWEALIHGQGSAGATDGEEGQ